jgi:hypothetical protein
MTIDMTRRILCALVLASALGCSSPTAPSATNAATAATTPGASTLGESTSQGVVSASRFGPRQPGVIYVTSQDLYYDTFVVKDPLPMKGPFQKLENGETQFGPGQPGYLGGRWWEDVNGNGDQDAADHFFLCPLLPPGRSQP